MTYNINDKNKQGDIKMINNTPKRRTKKFIVLIIAILVGHYR